ncbi:MAG: dTDP-4-dehydrorhamnose reductase [Planctomycetes bacterium]|nr:dTDP-4-dehydrorhamnose reductase [Planctomycetota bacterium]
MLGQDLVEVLRSRGHEVTPVDRPEGDVTRLEDCLRIVASARPDVVFHLAAFTDVDGAESREEEAFRTNALGARNVAVAAREACAGVLYVSTDYVFDGTGEGPYPESAEKRPVSAYGRTKDAGEELTRAHNPLYWVVRTSWLYGHGGRNFVETVLRLARERGRLTVVDDQHGAPTYTRDLAPALVEVVSRAHAGTYHATNGGLTTWYAFALRVLDLAGVKVPVEPMRSGDLDRPARRPANSALSDRALRRAGIPPLRSWEEALEDYFRSRPSPPSSQA